MARYRCPQCHKDLAERTKFFPFCSERCKLLDLGSWASEKFRIPAVEQERGEAPEEQQDSELDPESRRKK
jgi:uncharacterized protein